MFWLINREIIHFEIWSAVLMSKVSKAKQSAVQAKQSAVQAKQSSVRSYLLLFCVIPGVLEPGTFM